MGGKTDGLSSCTFSIPYEEVLCDSVCSGETGNYTRANQPNLLQLQAKDDETFLARRSS